MERNANSFGARLPEQSLLHAALSFAKEAHPVFPVHSPKDGSCSCHRPDCPSPAKHPRTRHGVYDATTDEAHIRRWWRRYPKSNIGLATGSPLLVVLDVDPRHGGDASLHALTRRFGALPQTRTVFTGGGGRHYYLQSEESLKFEDPAVPIAPVPRWLKELLSDQAPHSHDRQRTHLAFIEHPDPEDLLSWAIVRATPGNRNQTGFLLACRLRDLGWRPRKQRCSRENTRPMFPKVSTPIPAVKLSQASGKPINDDKIGANERVRRTALTAIIQTTERVNELRKQKQGK
jgi:hypothetical protein